jgi:hypothetical protein
MSFQYEKINPEICDSLKEIFQRPTTEWTDLEETRVLLIMSAITAAMKYRKTPLQTTTLPPGYNRCFHCMKIVESGGHECED